MRSWRPPIRCESLHFGEVAKYYTELEVPRGAYPARAMTERRWNSLTPQQQRVLEASTPDLGGGLVQRDASRGSMGEAEGRAQHVQFIPVRPAGAEALRRTLRGGRLARRAGLSRLGIDGAAVFRDARQIAQGHSRDRYRDLRRENHAAT